MHYLYDHFRGPQRASRILALMLTITAVVGCQPSLRFDLSSVGPDLSGFAEDLLTPALYVAPDGRAEWSGKLAEPDADGTDGPLPSILAARDRLRALRAAGELPDRPVIVGVLPGTYFLDEPVVFGPEDGGSKDNPVIYIGAQDDRPVISGGRRITGWRITDVKGKPAWVADLPEVKAGQWYFRQLFVNGRRCPRPRVPKEGFYEFTGLPEVAATTQPVGWNKGQTQATFKPGDIRDGKNLSDVEVVALHYWIESRLPIAEVDESANLMKFTRKSTFRLTDAHDLKKFARYYVENMADALDEPGEWYLDRSAGTLTYLPLPGETPDNTTVIAPRLDQLIRIVGDKDGKRPVFDIHLAGLTFSHTDWSLPPDDAGSVQAAFEVPGAIFLQRAGRCGIHHCTVSHVSNYAIEINAGCENIAIDRNVLTDLGAGGVKVGHHSNHSTVTNNEIGPGGHIFHGAIGVWVGASGDNVVSHNHIHHFYYTGISVGWSWGYRPSPAVRNIIEYNHIHDIGQGWLSDMGGIYTLGVSPGTRLRYNLIHDIEAHTYGGWGLYNDEGSTDILLENNIVYRTKHAGYHQHYGKENIIRNNIFAFGRLAQIQRSREEDHTSFIFERNIVYFSEPVLLDRQWKNEKFELDYNCYYRTGDQPFDFAGGSFEAWKKRGHDVHSVIADPRFVDPENGDFRLKPDSPAFELGFKPIDMSRIGPQKD